MEGIGKFLSAFFINALQKLGIQIVTGVSDDRAGGQLLIGNQAFFCQGMAAGHGDVSVAAGMQLQAPQIGIRRIAHGQDRVQGGIAQHRQKERNRTVGRLKFQIGKLLF